MNEIQSVAVIFIVLCGLIPGCFDTCQYTYSEEWTPRGEYELSPANGTYHGTTVMRHDSPPAKVYLSRQHGRYSMELWMTATNATKPVAHASIDGPRHNAPSPTSLIRETYESVGLGQLAPPAPNPPDEWGLNCLS